MRTGDKKDIMDHGAVTDLDIQALVDDPGCLKPGERERIIKVIANDAALRKKYDELIRQRGLIQLWWEESGNPASQ